MWLCTKFGFYSITQAQNAKDGTRRMQIRARSEAHLKALVQYVCRMDHALGHDVDGKILETPHADYRFRLVVTPIVAGLVIGHLAGSIDYPNFKDAAHKQNPKDVKYLDFLHRVWGIGLTMQPTRPFDDFGGWDNPPQVQTGTTVPYADPKPQHGVRGADPVRKKRKPAADKKTTAKTKQPKRGK